MSQSQEAGAKTMRRALYVLVLLTAVLVSLPSFSSATYTSTSDSTATVSAAADWTPPTVSVVSPGPAVQGTTTISADAADSGLGLKDVTIEYGVAGSGTWTPLCTDTTAPYSCAWATGALTDGQYVLRARATDLAGYATVSDAVRTAVANQLTVVMTDPGNDIRGTVQLTAGAYGVGALTPSVRFQYRAAGSTGSWLTACTSSAVPYTCAWNTAAVTSGDYEFRAVLTAGSTTVTSEVVTEVTIDNVAPTVTMTDPGTPLSGTRTFAATAADAHSGVAQVQIQYAASGTTAWKTLCTLTAEPWSCRAATGDLTNGTYSFRAVATDAAGTTTTSAAIANRVVDNTISSVSVNDPGALLARTVTLSATASSTAGVASVRLQYARTGTTTFTDICTTTAAPWSCAWDTTKVASAAYDLRAVMTDGRGQSVASALETTTVDNSPIAGADIQAFNGQGSLTGLLDANDTIAYTYTTQINPASVLPGWNGTATAVRVRLRDGALLWRRGAHDGLDVLTSSGSAALGLGEVNLKGDYVGSFRTVTFTATMTAETITVNGLERSVVTIRLGGPASGSTGDLKTVSATRTMVWSPLSTVTDLFGNRSSTAAVTEAGTADRDF